MCTSISFLTNNHYFGRNLDLEYSYQESVTITPRNYPFHFRETKTFRSHYALIGMATVADDCPLYYDATNEHGLSMAGLNFPGNAVYLPTADGKENIASFEFIPWVLAQCKTVDEAKKLLKRVNLIDMPFNEQFPIAPLHWMISDREKTIVAEPMENGVMVYENAAGVLTNNPPFPYHMYNLCNYMNLSTKEPVNRLSAALPLEPYSRGMGAIGLPGDLSSASRFVRAAFTKFHSVCDGTEMGSVSQFFHILDSVVQARGCTFVNDAFEITLYSSCCNTDKGIYYYKTYDNSQLTAVHLFREDLSGCKLVSYPLRKEGNIFDEN